MIIWKLKDDGAFIAGDTATGFTAYAYPTSVYATQAKRAPFNVAADMLAFETPWYRGPDNFGMGPHVIARDAAHFVELVAL